MTQRYLRAKFDPGLTSGTAFSLRLGNQSSPRGTFGVQGMLLMTKLILLSCRYRAWFAILVLTCCALGSRLAVAQTSPQPTTAPAVSTAAPGSVFTDVPDPTKPEQRSDPSGLDFGGSLYKPNGWLAGWSAGGTTGDPGQNDGSDWQPFGYDKDKDGNLAKDKDGKPVPSKPTVEALVPMIAHAYTSINFTWGLV